MTTEFSMLGIMNAAMMAQGQESILSENDGSLEWEMLFRNWPIIVESELETGRYNFTRTQLETTTHSAGRFGKEDAYLIPSEVLCVRRVWIADSVGSLYSIDWVSDGDYVYIDHPGGDYVDGITMDVTTVADQHVWNANFVRGMTLSLEALIAKGVKEEFREAKDLEMQARYFFEEARKVSSQERAPRPPYKQGRLSRARRG